MKAAEDLKKREDKNPVLNAMSVPYSKTSPAWQAKTKALATFIRKDLRPIKTISGSGFKEFVNALDPRFTIPTEGIIGSRCFCVTFFPARGIESGDPQASPSL